MLRQRRVRSAARVDGWDVSGAEAALARLSRRLMQAHEEERAWIARAIHDDVCQQLTGLTLRLHALGTAPDGPSGERRVRIQESLISFTRWSARFSRISDPLYPDCSARTGDVGADLLREPVRRARSEPRLSGRDGIHARARPGGAGHFPRAAGVARQRHRARASVARHCRAGGKQRRDRSRGRRRRRRLRSEAIRGSAVGLVAIRERLRIVGGTCAFASQPGAGTRILARVPL